MRMFGSFSLPLSLLPFARPAENNAPVSDQSFVFCGVVVNVIILAADSISRTMGKQITALEIKKKKIGEKKGIIAWMEKVGEERKG